jgi:Ca-activated chloride channel family protein
VNGVTGTFRADGAGMKRTHSCHWARLGSTLLGLNWVFVSHSALGQMVVERRWDENTPSDGGRLSLEKETLTVTIDQQYAKSVLSQVYLNPTEGVVEGSCTVRAGEGATVQSFAYWNGTAKIVGEVFEKEVAREIYEQTTGRRRDPGLLETTGEGAFAFRVFPINAGEHKRVEVTLGQRLMRKGEHVEYRMPLASPGASVTIDLSDSRQLAHLSSTSHRLATTAGASGGLRITASPLGEPKEIVLGYDVVEAPFTLSVAKHQDRGQDAYLTISLATPTLPAGREAKDVTIVLDHSGSMDGTPLSEARAAAKEIVRQLTDKDHLDIVAFDDTVDTLFSSMEPVTTQSRKAALDFLDRQQSGGGTDLASALSRALSFQRSKAERPLVFFLTDGESDAAAVLDVAQKDRSKVRVFTVGIGQGVNRPLLSQLADQKRGKFTYIQSAEAIRSSVEHLFGLAETPVLVTPELTLENGTLLARHPETLSDLAPGEELLVTARARGQGPMRLVLRGKGPQGPVVSEAQFNLGTAERRPWVGRLWAKNRVDRILEDISLKGETDERRNEAIELALSYALVTPYTSFLAIPESELTGQTSELMKDARSRKRAILAKRQDAVALSRSDMPPGDPVLTVDAPANALRVTAFFPFGLEKELRFDPDKNNWRVRFLVPKDTPDGSYEVPVLIVHRDGREEWVTGRYVIDSEEPEFEPMVQCVGDTMEISVVVQSRMREVRAAWVTDSSRRIGLALDPKDPRRSRYLGTMKIGSPSDAVRIVVTDMARNEGEEIVRCPSPKAANR